MPWSAWWWPFLVNPCANPTWAKRTSPLKVLSLGSPLTHLLICWFVHPEIMLKSGKEGTASFGGQSRVSTHHQAHETFEHAQLLQCLLILQCLCSFHKDNKGKQQKTTPDFAQSKLSKLNTSAPQSYKLAALARRGHAEVIQCLCEARGPVGQGAEEFSATRIVQQTTQNALGIQTKGVHSRWSRSWGGVCLFDDVWW